MTLHWLSRANWNTFIWNLASPSANCTVSLTVSARLSVLPRVPRICAGSLGLTPDTFAFFYVGRLNPIKDLGTLLDAFAALPGDISFRSSLYLVGDGPDRAMLEARRDALGLRERVAFLGARSDVAEVLMAADAFVMSSISEGLPMALLEAMAAGVPCIATAAGAFLICSQTRGVYRYLPGMRLHCTQAMTTVVRSPELRQRLINNAAANLEHYGLDAIAGSNTLNSWFATDRLIAQLKTALRDWLRSMP